MCIGEIGLSKEEYCNLTPAETAAKVHGYLYNKDAMSANFRALFTLNFNQWAKKGEQKSPERLWPLEYIDWKPDAMTKEEMYERNKRIELWAEDNWDRLFSRN